MPSESYEIVPSLINGEWLSINKDKYTNVYNPAKGEIISISFLLNSYFPP